jgi:hypothetical protein
MFNNPTEEILLKKNQVFFLWKGTWTGPFGCSFNIDCSFMDIVTLMGNYIPFDGGLSFGRL